MSDDDFSQLQFAERAPVPVGRPWPRYFARMLDSLLFGMVGIFILTIVLVITTKGGADRLIAMTTGVGGLFVSSVLTFVLALLPIAFLIALAQTPGKWLFGIRVRNPDGSRLKFAKALKREGWVLMRGLGFGIPLISLGTLVTSYVSLKEDGYAPWDERLGCEVRHSPVTWFWWVRATFGALLFFAANFWGYFTLLRSMVAG